MTQAGTQQRSRFPITLNSDGERHPVLNAVAVLTFLTGIAVFLAGFVRSLHLAASVVGLAGLGVGIVAQMTSATREQRILIVPGIIGFFVGMSLGIAHGGF